MLSGLITYEAAPLQGALANVFLILINTLFFNVKMIGQSNQYPDDSSSKLVNGEEKIFDFIIVGGGTAGCVVANRLSEHQQWSVLLIEAGDYPQPSSTVPAFYPTFWDSSTDTWQYTFEKDKNNCRVYRNQQCSMSRGRLLGGTSAINNMHYYKDPNSHNNTYTKIYKSIEYDSNIVTTKGGIHFEKSNTKSIIRTVLIQAYHTLGYSLSSDKNPIGLVENYLTIKNGERHDMAKSFLTPIKHRPNFFLTKNTMVEALEIADQSADKRVKGVNIAVGNARLFIEARKEIILTAGAINNAKLLILSGLGAKEYLEKRKIPVVLDLPAVGKNLQFHLSVPIFIGLNASMNSSIDEISTENDLVQDTFDYLMYRTGSLAHTDINDLALYISTEQYSANPNLGIYHQYFKINDRLLNIWLNGLNFDKKVMKKLLEKNKFQPILLFMITLLRPKSRGYITINETHYQGNPNLFGNFLSDTNDEDLQSLIGGFSLVNNLVDKTLLKTDFGAEFLDLNVPNCQNFKFCSLHYVKCYIHSMIYPTSDVSGTTLRGPECDQNAVVNSDFQVKHIRCLRIADSSILNEIPVSNTMATDAMLAAKLCEILKEKWIKDYVSSFK